MTSPETLDRPLLAAITIMGSGRIGPTVAALIGLGGVVVGARTLVRSTSTLRLEPATVGSHHPRTADAAVLLGSVSLALGALFAATADGGPGTGNGIVGSVVAIVLGPIAVVLGVLARRRTSPSTA